MTGTPLLSIDGLAVSYGAVQAVRGVSLAVGKGEAVALLGANGAGKSSLLNAVMGLVPGTTGAVAFRGQPIARKAPEQIAALGLTLVFEGRRVFPKLSVDENLRLGAVAGRGRVDAAARLAEMRALFPVLGERAHQAAGTLSGGEQQMLAIARALMSAPEMVLLDEPSLGLAPQVVEDVFAMIERLKAMGTTILLVEQNVEMGLSVADRAYVMQSGAIVDSGDARALAAGGRLAEAYLAGA
ncbi:MAG: ABC transporter ATP-binding protein [Alphaproteobacteria bacterium]